MKPNSRFELLKNPQQTSLEELGSNGFTTLLAAGIVNPFGPTLNVLAADGMFDEGGVIPIVQMMLNPFSQSFDLIGQVQVGESWSPLGDLAPFFSLPFGACPTLLVPSNYLDDGMAVKFHARFLMGFEDGCDVLGRVRKHPGDPWSRVQEEVSSLGDILGNLGGDGPEKASKRNLSEEQATELASLQLKPENLQAELKAFMFAWNGAVEFQGEGGLAAGAMSLKEFLELFSQLGATCSLPAMQG